MRAERAGSGYGARFTISLPARSTAAQSLVATSQLDIEDASSDVLQGINALVVEDNVTLLEFLIRILEERGALVMGARSAGVALEALRAADSIPFNVLVTDIGLPGMDGYELLRQIRGDLKFSPERLAAVAVTAFGRKEDRQGAFEAGCQAHLSKPYEVAQFVATVRRLVQGATP